ncbi:MAG TPA: prolyl oligopeptidase family serine peptidase [Armatimonadota bacterium]|jgi:predicted peptidase
MINKRRRWMLALLTVFAVAALAMPAVWHFRHSLKERVISALPLPVESQARTFRDERGESLNYRLVLPKGYRPNRHYPLVVSLHGSGESGTGNMIQMHTIVPLFLTPENRGKYPCFILAPQCPPNTYWVDMRTYVDSRIRQAATPSVPIRLTIHIIESLMKEFPIDRGRIYVIGYSAGGHGAWDIITRRSELFAAAVVLSGRGDPSKTHCIAHLPVWVFHGVKDKRVGINCARVMVRALRQVGGNLRYTEYPDSGHEAGPRALGEPELLPWMFSQHR